MRASSTIVLAAGLLSLLAAGPVACRHKALPPPPQASTAPPLPPTSMTQLPAVPPLPAPEQPHVGPPGPAQTAQQPPQTPPPRHPRHAKKHPVDPAAAGAPASSQAATQTAAGTPPPAPTLGELSAGSGADGHERAAMNEQIHAQELRLSKIKHPLNDEDQAIGTQIRVFLLKARQAVDDNDLDGAQTLTTKAKVLLDELTQS